MENRKTQLSEMCRIEQVIEMRERIRIIKEKLQQYSPTPTESQS